MLERLKRLMDDVVDSSMMELFLPLMMFVYSPAAVKNQNIRNADRSLCCLLGRGLIRIRHDKQRRERLRCVLMMMVGRSRFHGGMAGGVGPVGCCESIIN